MLVREQFKNQTTTEAIDECPLGPPATAFHAR